jgi:uncharacterized GH25 family protein
MKKMVFVFFALLAAAPLAQAQLIKTQLILKVVDELGNPVGQASVKLFETEADYTQEKNVAFEGTTDDKGVVQFKRMKAIQYFLIVRKDDRDNQGGGEKVGPLEENKFNKATVVIQ